MVSSIREATVAMDREAGKVSATQDGDDLGIVVALSAGELPRPVLQDLWDAGARRYLMRIETSNPALFASLHPAKQTWQSRVANLELLKGMGFQLGTGVMVGLPGQTNADLAGDVEFFRKASLVPRPLHRGPFALRLGQTTARVGHYGSCQTLHTSAADPPRAQIDADMIGMGPFITEEGTPATELWKRTVASPPGFDKPKHMAEMVLQTMRMNALARINLGNVNIAATTALQALDAMGREIALSRGANILMPILTPTKYRENYQLYEGKPCITDTAEECRRCLNARVSMVGKHLLPSARSDPPHYRSPATRPSDPPGTRRFGSRAFATGTHPPCRSAVAAPQVPHTPGPAKGSDVPRTNVGVFGSMNAGKSTLMNQLIKDRLSIVTSKAQTTRHRIMGITTGDNFQIISNDTPGVLLPAYKMQESMMKFVTAALQDADVILLVTDVFEQDFPDPDLLERLRNVEDTPILLLINKVDMLRPGKLSGEKLKEVGSFESISARWAEILPCARQLGISAMDGTGTDEIPQIVKDLLPFGPPLFPDDVMSDKPTRFFAAEIIREKIFESTHKEVPYSCEVVIDSFSVGEKKTVIEATIVVSRDSQKGMVIGKGGEKIKEIRSKAEKSLHEFLDTIVRLKLQVKVEKDWRSKETFLKDYGYL